MNSFIKYAIAAGLVLACSITESQAQQRPNYNNVQVNRVTNVYGGGYGYNRGWNNGVGMWPGSGPYDSMIAVTGIAAGASVINNLINSTARQQPPVVVQQGYPMAAPVVVGAPIAVQGYAAGIPGAPVCSIYVTGVNPAGNPVTVRSCQ